MTEVERVAILGAGDEGCTLALAAALARCAVRLHDDDGRALDAAQERLRARVEDALRAGRIGPVEKQRALDAILATTDLSEALTHADLVVAAAARDAAALRSVAARLGEGCRASALVATSAAAPDALADVLPQPGRLFGLRWRTGARAASLDVVPSARSSPDALRRAERIAVRLAREGGAAVLRG